MIVASRNHGNWALPWIEGEITLVLGWSLGTSGFGTASSGGGERPLWSPDGRELFYRQGARLMVPVSAGPEFSAGTPRALFDGYETDPDGITNYDVSPDGEQFLMVQGEAGSLTKIIIAQNWVEEPLKRLVPTED